MTSLLDIVRSTIARRELSEPGEPIVVLVSGGGDSVALLLLAADGVLGDGPVSALHVNHLLRGEASDADEAFVATLCDRLGVNLCAIRTDVAEYAASADLNLEDAGRRVRYRLAQEELDERCTAAGHKPGSGTIATAHTLDDRVETMLMRLVTGAGAGGLSSIPYRRGRIVRPLLDVRRDDLRAMLRERNQDWREDETNQDTERLRAFVRHEVLPLFERVNPSARTTLARIIDIVGDEDALLGEMAEGFALQFGEFRPGVSVQLNRSALATLSRAMMRRTVRSALLRTFPEASRLDAEHVDAIVDGIDDPRFCRDLPFGLRAESEYTVIRVSSTHERTLSVAPSLLTLPGKVDLGEAGEMLAEETEPHDVAGARDSVVIDASSIGSLLVDGVRPGDRMQPLGMSGTRKLSDMLIDAKVPKRERSGTPVVRSGDRIAWLAGVRMSEEFRVGPQTKRAIRLSWRRSTSERTVRE